MTPQWYFPGCGRGWWVRWGRYAVIVLGPGSPRLFSERHRVRRFVAIGHGWRVRLEPWFARFDWPVG